MQQELDSLRAQFAEDLARVATQTEIELLKSRYVGKNGLLTQLYQRLSQFSVEERRQWGQRLNAVRSDIESRLEVAFAACADRAFAQSWQKETIDTTLPLPEVLYQGRHPISQTMEFLIDMLVEMGFDIGSGPDIEHEDYNFTFLNIPEHHPARDDHDTIYITKPWLLRTHTSPVQLRYMRNYRDLPIQMIAPGRVYRADDDDATHSSMFHQIEGLWVDSGIHFGHLKAILKTFLHRVFDVSEVRFRPSFYPFTEPSADVDMQCVFCHHVPGQKCRVCKGTGWLEIMGAGLVHPRVLKYGGVASEGVSGLAFGMGVERMAMFLFGISNIGMLYENDPRILNQVARSYRFPHLGSRT